MFDKKISIWIYVLKMQIRMELRSMPQTKILCEQQLGNLWKMVHHPVFRHFKSWRGAVEETKKRESDHRVAKCHQFCTFVARKTLKTFSSDFTVLCHYLFLSLSFFLFLSLFSDQKVYGQCFQKWRELFHETISMSKASNHHQRYLIKMALDEWVSLHLIHRNMHQMMVKADAFRDKQLLKRQVFLWMEWSRRRRGLEQKKIALMEQLRSQKMWNVMLRWTASANKLQVRRKRTWMSYEFRASQLKRKCLSRWIHQFQCHSSLKQRERQFRGQRQYKLMQELFYKWCHTYNASIYKADLLRNHYEEVCLYRLSKYFTLWHSVYQCVRDTDERYIKLKTLTGWRHATKRRKQFKRKILQKPYLIHRVE